MILLLILPINVSVGPINLPALALFILSLIYMFMTFLEFFIADEVVFDKDKASDTVSNVREITGEKLTGSVTGIKDRFKSMKDTINQISDENLDVGVEGEIEEEKELIEETVEE